MDKRYKPLTTSEQFEARMKLYDTLRENPGMSLPDVLKLIRTTLRIKNEDISKMSGVSAKFVGDTIAGRGNPSLKTAAELLKPFGLRVGVVLEKIESSTKA